MARILVVDDDSQVRDVLIETLEEAGYEVVGVPDGREVLKLLKKMPFDMVITDIIMPEKEGIETILEFRQVFPDLKFIAISGGGRFGPLSNYLEIARNLGAYCTFSKPFEQKELLEAVDSALRG